MKERRTITLRAPITLGVVMIVAVVVLIALWIIGNALGPEINEKFPLVFWALLATGGILLLGILLGVIAYLTLTVKAVNLNRRQSNFIDSVTHELKSPIASLKLYLQTMTRRTVEQEQQQHFHKIMLEDVERLDSLINHLLDAGRIERGVETNENENVSLRRLLRQCSTAACARYKVPQSTVTIDSPSVVLNSQLIQLEILFRNLIDNAVKYGGDPPEVIVTVKPVDDDKVVVFVADNGNGIPSNQRKKVFGRFVRLGNELERSKPGTGLGLYLVRNVTHALGGSIAVRGRKNQSGTEFEVRLGGLVSITDAPEDDELTIDQAAAETEH